MHSLKVRYRVRKMRMSDKHSILERGLECVTRALLSRYVRAQGRFTLFDVSNS
jgi:hypothetical protein